ncbi:MAG: type II toxin-antitoxin system VapC family toxin [Acinetobacter sp.]|uniref:type II toxin-antitoxin system VapC family toxin n=1 Tax=Acinetobacter sp. TaxID=472 RepID=UPI000FB589E7|nr:type II toxin-antitoxin system VapC family toxin [Acinetobacter sp.]RUP40654.1 MAG: type II toxin-antitoxin system VapC family toxin [Acinetobacter sp.]
MAVVVTSDTPDFMLDTSAYSAFNRGDKRLKQFFNPENQLIMPLIVIGELRAGFALGSRQQENETLLQKLLDSPNVHPITISDTTTKLFAAINKKLKRAGTPINVNDVWVAALALEHGCLLVTLDSDFARVPDLMIAQL